MFLRRLGRPGIFLQLLVPSVIAVILCTGLVQAWTLRVSAQAMDDVEQHNLTTSMALLHAYLDPLGTTWSRVDGQLRLGTTALRRAGWRRCSMVMSAWRPRCAARTERARWARGLLILR